ncbi:MAG: 4'-phosphopantetheinyl transferase superfamily protein [bacterium]
MDTDALCQQPGSVLSETEASRAARFSTPLLARRYAGAHAALRRLLAAENGSSARALRFGESARGKPVLLSTSQEFSLDFNLSHSGPWVLVGVARGLHIGVDIEEVTHHHDWPLVAAEILAPLELSALHQRPPDLQPEFLIRTWTTKEACLKGMGAGLSIHPQRLVCRMTTGNGIAFDLDGQPLETRYAWNTIGPDFSASIVALKACTRGSSAGGTACTRR